MAQQGWGRGVNLHPPPNSGNGPSSSGSGPSSSGSGPPSSGNGGWESKGSMNGAWVQNDERRVDGMNSTRNTSNERFNRRGSGTNNADNGRSKRQAGASQPLAWSNRGGGGGELDHAPRRRDEFQTARRFSVANRVDSNSRQDSKVVHNNRDTDGRWGSTTGKQAILRQGTEEDISVSYEDSRGDHQTKRYDSLSPPSLTNTTTNSRRPQRGSETWGSDASRSSRSTSSNRDNQNESPMKSARATQVPTSIEGTNRVPKHMPSDTFNTGDWGKIDRRMSQERDRKMRPRSFGRPSFTEEERQHLPNAATLESPDEARGSGFVAQTTHTMPKREWRNTTVETSNWGHNDGNSRDRAIGLDLETHHLMKGHGSDAKRPRNVATGAWGNAPRDKATNWNRASSSAGEKAGGWGSTQDARRTAKRLHSELAQSGGESSNDTVENGRRWDTITLGASSGSQSAARLSSHVWGSNTGDETNSNGRRDSATTIERARGWGTSSAALETADEPKGSGSVTSEPAACRRGSDEWGNQFRNAARSSDEAKGWETGAQTSGTYDETRGLVPFPGTADNRADSTSDKAIIQGRSSSNTHEKPIDWETGINKTQNERWRTDVNRRKAQGWGKSNAHGASTGTSATSLHAKAGGWETTHKASGWGSSRRASDCDKSGLGTECAENVGKSDHLSNKSPRGMQFESSHRKRRIEDLNAGPSQKSAVMQNGNAADGVDISPSGNAATTVTPENTSVEDTDSSSVSGGLNIRIRHRSNDPRSRRPPDIASATTEYCIVGRDTPSESHPPKIAPGEEVGVKQKRAPDEEVLRERKSITDDQQVREEKIDDEGSCLVDSPSPQRHGDNDEEDKVSGPNSNASSNEVTVSSGEPTTSQTIGGNPIICRGVSLPTDVVHIDEVEWATPEDNRRTTEKAFRPKLDRNFDPCGCQPDGSGELCCTDLSCVLYACQEECRPNCLAGPFCNNRRISQRKWKKVEVIDAGPKGRGLRILEPAKASDLIAEYVGVAVKKKALDRLFDEYRTESMLYIMALDNNVYIDARKRGGVARYINHSCEPNCAVHRWKVRGVSRTGVFALRDIEEGEELSFDYKWTRKRGRAPTKCHCYSATCRGTLELPSEAVGEEDVPRISGDWKVPKGSDLAGVAILNRTVKIYFPEWGEYFAADVSQFNKEDGRHLIIYKDDMEESWVDLSKEQWMILDEGAAHFVIAKKTSSLASTSVVEKQVNGDNEVKNYVYVSSYVKDLLMKKIIGRCEQFFRCKISIAEAPEEPSDGVDSTQEMDIKTADNDPKMWKLTIISVDPKRAREFLQSNADHIRKNAPRKASIVPNGTTSNVSGSHRRTQQDPSPDLSSEEILVPSSCSDQLRSRIRDLRCQVRAVDFNFGGAQESDVHSLTLESSSVAEIARATVAVWNEINKIGFQTRAEITPAGVFKNLGFFAGQLQSSDGELLRLRGVMSCHDREFLADVRDSLFIGAFEEHYNCTVLMRVNDTQNDASWDDDEERMIDVFFGCDPRGVRHLWSCLRTLVKDLGRGIKLLDLGVDKDYISLLSQSPEPSSPDFENGFLAFIKETVGVTVKRDEALPMFLRMDCGSSMLKKEDVMRRVQLAEDMIRLQIELFRDTSLRTRSWMFGRDWSHVEEPGTTPLPQDDSSRSKSPLPMRRLPSALNNISDSRSVAVVCVQLAEIVESLGLDSIVAVHACLILYRFLQQILRSSTVSTQFKLHDVAVSCLFLAVKAQKLTRWKRLNSVLCAAYNVFYPHAQLDEKSEEAAQFAKRVLGTEEEILKLLDYDLFWDGFDNIASAAIRSGRIAEPLVHNVLQHATMGPVIAAGPLLWLGLGPEHVFAAVAGMLSIDLQPLFETLTLDPRKVVHAVDIITKSIVDHESQQKRTAQSNKRHRHSFFGGQKAMLSQVAHVQQACQRREEILSSQQSYSKVAPRLQAPVASRTRKLKLLEGVAAEAVTGLIPHLARIQFESCARLYIDWRVDDEFYSLFGEGCWQALAIARHFLGNIIRPGDGATLHSSHSTRDDHHSCTVTGDSGPVTGGRCIDAEDLITKPSTLETKLKPGVLRSGDIDFDVRWDCCESAILGLSEARKTGGKLIRSVAVPRSCLIGAGLRWWILNPWYPTSTGFFNESFEVKKLEGDASRGLQQVRFIAKCTGGNGNEDENEVSRLQFPGLELVPGCTRKIPSSEALTVRRWPSEKTEIREKKNGTSGMGSGFSPAALQEMQLLRQLHASFNSSQGHPNIILPVAIAIGSSSNEMPSSSQESMEKKSRSDLERLISGAVDQDSVEGERCATADASYLVFKPLPFTLNRVLAAMRTSRGKGDSGSDAHLVTPTLLQCWSRDILSALHHCHSNHVVIRTISPEHVFVDQNGVLQLSGLAKAIVIHPDDRDRVLDPLEGAVGGEEIPCTDFSAPELLLGAVRESRETDIWSVGCLIAHLLLGKPLFSGRSRFSKALSILKVVGTPSSNNYPDAAKFPYFEKSKPSPPKKYKRGVEKALRYLIGESRVKQRHDAIMLLDRIFHLDPRQRISAQATLRDPYLADDRHCLDPEQRYVDDWLLLKKQVTSSLVQASDKMEAGDEDQDQEWGKKADSSTRSFAAHVQASENGLTGGSKPAEIRLNESNSSSRLNPAQVLIETVTIDDDDGDDLYNMDELDRPSKTRKRSRTE